MYLSFSIMGVDAIIGSFSFFFTFKSVQILVFQI